MANNRKIIVPKVKNNVKPTKKPIRNFFILKSFIFPCFRNSHKNRTQLTKRQSQAKPKADSQERRPAVSQKQEPSEAIGLAQQRSPSMNIHLHLIPNLIHFTQSHIHHVLVLAFDYFFHFVKALNKLLVRSFQCSFRIYF